MFDVWRVTKEKKERVTCESVTCNEKKENTSNDAFWALKDINLEIKQGEIVGIIGPRGRHFDKTSTGSVWQLSAARGGEIDAAQDPVPRHCAWNMGI